MKKRVLLPLAVSIISFLSGFVLSEFRNMSREKESLKISDQLRISTEKYMPSCEELRNNNIPEIVKKDGKFFFVKTMNNYFYVMGFEFEEERPPDIYWWGASRDFEIKEKCK